jgi:hypothetical protein
MRVMWGWCGALDPQEESATETLRGLRRHQRWSEHLGVSKDAWSLRDWGNLPWLFGAPRHVFVRDMSDTLFAEGGPGIHDLLAMPNAWADATEGVVTA